MRIGESSRDFTDTQRRRSSIFYRENKTITQSQGYLAEETLTFLPTVKRRGTEKTVETKQEVRN